MSPSPADSSDDDQPLSALVSKAAKSENGKEKPASSEASPATAVNGAAKAAGVDDDDDDDLPIAALVQKAPAEGKKRKLDSGSVGNGSEKKKKKEKATEEKRPKRTADDGSQSAGKAKPKKSTSGSKKSHVDHTQRFYGTVKGELVQKLLCRWWYAIQWPEPGETEPAPPDYEILAGYPGVFVCVKGEQIGHVLDRRNPATCPNFTNLSRKPAEELQELLVKALEEQKRQLLEHEGSNRKMEKRIDKEIKWARGVNPKTADSEARREGFPTAE